MMDVFKQQEATEMTINKIKVKETQRYYGDFEGSLESMIASLQADLDAGWNDTIKTLKDKLR